MAECLDSDYIRNNQRITLERLSFPKFLMEGRRPPYFVSMAALRARSGYVDSVVFHNTVLEADFTLRDPTQEECQQLTQIKGIK